jgi:GH25 family lysozyme M1 (1,4-beta-N-acetylmuramidase)
MHTHPRADTSVRPRPATLRRSVIAGLCAALAATLAIAGTVTSSADPESEPGSKAVRPKAAKQHPGVSDAAAAVGITAAGGGYAGWAADSHRLQESAASDAGRTLRARRADGRTPMLAVRGVHGVAGLDVSVYQGRVNWHAWRHAHRRFAYIKATEGAHYHNPRFSSQYRGAYRAGLLHGAYHYARPDGAPAAVQARYFADHGGSWSRDGRTLPGALDIEDNYTGGNRCWGNSRAHNRAWINHFLHTYYRITHRHAVIYTNAPFWRDCVYSHRYHRKNPLWIAAWGSRPPRSLPGNWPWWTFWQYDGTGTDLNRFNGNFHRLRRLALNKH